MKISEIIKAGITAGKSTEAILAEVHAAHPDAETKAASVAWYKAQMKKDHMLVAPTPELQKNESNAWMVRDLRRRVKYKIAFVDGKNRLYTNRITDTMTTQDIANIIAQRVLDGFRVLNGMNEAEAIAILKTLEVN